MKRGSPIKEQTDEWVWAVQAQHKHDTVLQGLTVLILNLIKLHKVCIFCFALLIPQILVNFQNQGLIWNLLVQTFSKDPLHVQFDQVLAEIFEVKEDENNINLNNLCQQLFCSPSKLPISLSTRIILRNTMKRPRMFNQLLSIQNVQISIV